MRARWGAGGTSRWALGWGLFALGTRLGALCAGLMGEWVVRPGCEGGAGERLDGGRRRRAARRASAGAQDGAAGQLRTGQRGRGNGASGREVQAAGLSALYPQRGRCLLLPPAGVRMPPAALPSSRPAAPSCALSTPDWTHDDDGTRPDAPLRRKQTPLAVRSRSPSPISPAQCAPSRVPSAMCPQPSAQRDVPPAPHLARAP